LGLGLDSVGEYTGVTDMESWPARAAQAFADELPQDMVRLTRVVQHERSTEVHVHPAEEPVRFRISDNGEPSVSARTSSAGPGYHAFIVEQLDACAALAGVRWTWMDDQNNPGDETGYANNRDLNALQHAMLSWLTELAKILLERPVRGAGIALPLHTDATLDPAFAFSPMGAWPRRFFDELLTADDTSQRHAGHRFFPWWDLERDAAKWANVARVLGMHEVTWSAPATDDEVRSQTIALFALERAKLLDPLVPCPSGWLDDLRDLNSDRVALDAEPDPNRMGFRRRPMRRRLPGGWSIDLPGWYHRTWEEGQPVFWHGPHTVHISVFSYTPDGRPASDWLPPLERLSGSGELQRLVRDQDAEPGHALLRNDPIDGLLIQGFVAGARNILLVTVLFAHHDEAEWAERVWRSVRAPRDGAGGATH
jgi:hypothetical protein